MKMNPTNILRLDLKGIIEEFKKSGDVKILDTLPQPQEEEEEEEKQESDEEGNTLDDTLNESIADDYSEAESPMGVNSKLGEKESTKQETSVKLREDLENLIYQNQELRDEIDQLKGINFI